jgi:hypothetical protein
VAEQAGQSPGELLAALFAIAQTVGAWPLLDMPVDVVTVEYAAAAIWHLARRPDAVGATFHLTHPAPVDLATLARRVPAMRLLPYDAWREALSHAADRFVGQETRLIASLIAGYEESDITPARIDCRATSDALRGTPVTCPPVETVVRGALHRSLMIGGRVSQAIASADAVFMP